MAERYTLATIQKGGETKQVYLPQKNVKEELRKLNREGWVVKKSTMVSTTTGKEFTGRYVSRYQKSGFKDKIPQPKEDVKTVVVPSQKKVVGVSPGVAEKIRKESEFQSRREKQIKSGKLIPSPTKIRVGDKDVKISEDVGGVVMTSEKDIPVGLSYGVSQRYSDIASVEPARQELIKEIEKKELQELSVGKKVLLGSSIFFSPKSYEVAFSPFQSKFGKDKKPVKDILQDIGIERLKEARVERTPLQSGFWGVTESLKSPVGVYVGSQALGAVFGGLSQSSTVGKIAGTRAIGSITTGELGKIGALTLFAGGTLKTGKTTYEQFEAGEISKGLGTVSSYGIGIIGFRKGYKAGVEQFKPDPKLEKITKITKIEEKRLLRKPKETTFLETEDFNPEDLKGSVGDTKKFKFTDFSKGKDNIVQAYTGDVKVTDKLVSGKPTRTPTDITELELELEKSFGLKTTIKTNIDIDVTGSGVGRFRDPKLLRVTQFTFKKPVSKEFVSDLNLIQPTKTMGKLNPFTSISEKPTKTNIIPITNIPKGIKTKDKTSDITGGMGISTSKKYTGQRLVSKELIDIGLEPITITAPRRTTKKEQLSLTIQKSGRRETIDTSTSLLSSILPKSKSASEQSFSLSSVLGSASDQRQSQSQKVNLSSLTSTSQTQKQKTRQRTDTRSGFDFPITPFVGLPNFPSFGGSFSQPKRKRKKTKTTKKKKKGIWDILPLADPLSLLQTEALTGRKALQPRNTPSVRKAFIQEFTLRPATGRFPTPFQVRQRRKKSKKLFKKVSSKSRRKR